jgi:uncharacterized protein with ParB-like and HNH nuclease domain
MKPSIQTLGQILYSPSQYVIPVFQRHYRWERPQWDKLWEGLEEIQEPTKQGNHFMGFLVFVPGLPEPGQNTTFHLIDGQQRLATLSLLLAAIRNVAREEGLTDLADEIHQDYLIHPRKRGDERYRLLPKERDHDSYVGVIEGKDDAAGRVAEALVYFEDRLAGMGGEGPDRLRLVFNTVCQRMEFMCATLETENAYNIFKSLNSTGVPLGPSDLIRNFVFMHVAPQDHDAFDEELWAPLEERFLRDDHTLDDARFSQFFRDFLMSTIGRYIAPKDTFSAFEARYEATGFSPRELAGTLERYVQFYEAIAGKKPDSDAAVTDALSGLNVLESSTTYPLLLSFFDRRAAGDISSTRLAEAVQMLRGFILRRFICGESSRGYGQMLVRAIPQEAGDRVTALERYLVQRGWPDDRRFETAFVEFPLYERGYAREVLETLERARGHREPANLGDAEIEHVLPQTLNVAWRDALGPEAERIHADLLHRPGNLTLSAYNAELWNHEFVRKRERYAESNVGLTRELSQYDSWGEAEIHARGRKLAKQSASIWRGPSEQAIQPATQPEAELEPERFELRRRFWAGLADRLASEHPDLPSPDSRAASVIRLASGARHVGFELQFNLKRQMVVIDVWFWRQESMPLWESLRSRPEVVDGMFGEAWSFEKVEGRERGRMSLEHAVAELRDERVWPAAQGWLCGNLIVLYREFVPWLRRAVE